MLIRLILAMSVALAPLPVLAQQPVQEAAPAAADASPTIAALYHWFAQIRPSTASSSLMRGTGRPFRVTVISRCRS